jgi:hypothetical protein
LVVIIGAAFLLVGAVLNARYVRELFVNRGPLRRREENIEETLLADREASVQREISDRPADEAPAAARDRSWDGMERRQTPRDRERKPPRRGSSAEDSPRG